MTDAPSPITASFSPDELSLEVDARVFDRRAVLTATYELIDRAYVSLSTHGDRARIELRPKGDTKLDPSLEHAVIDALWEARLAGAVWKNGKALVDRVVLTAFGGEVPAEAAPELPPLSEADLAAFDDPLGIAESWEAKHAKKGAR